MTVAFFRLLNKCEPFAFTKHQTRDMMRFILNNTESIMRSLITHISLAGLLIWAALTTQLPV